MNSKAWELSQNWQIKERNTALNLEQDFASHDDWLAAEVPGSIHEALLKAERIPDPFYGLNEHDIQWVGERDWLYRCRFSVEPEAFEVENLLLQFDGLDTYATVWLNGTEILTSENMFVPQSSPVKNLLRPGTNELQIHFASALLRGQALEARYGKRQGWNGDLSRLYVRKAQYHYGWDWGPVIMTAGPWRAVRLVAYTGRIADLLCSADVNSDLSQATLPIKLDLELPPTTTNLNCQIEVYDPSGQTVLEHTFEVSSAHHEVTLNIAQPELWWVRGHGPQPLYQLVVTLRQGTQNLDQRTLRLGLRRARVVQHPLEGQSGLSFYLEINNRAIFCGGADWIPADIPTTRISKERYRAWVELAAQGNMNMLRVWGGGIYEEDVFYETCDELGILVWQDFMFACGMYPAHDWFLQSVKQEAEAAVRRLHHHPSIVLWCGNNEDYMHAWSVKAYDSSFNGDLTTIPFAGREIYERLLPEVCARLDANRFYWPGSPYGGNTSNNIDEGDQHFWAVWHGHMQSYHDYPKLGGRFISEFGMQALPARETFDAVIPEHERYPLSRTLEHHNKAPDGSRRLAVYVSDTTRIPTDLDSYTYATQFVQSEALCAGIKGWRRQWQGPGKEYVGGALIWQLNDCWPVTSWAMVDSELRPKPAYYSVKRELAPFVVGLAACSPTEALLWVVNDTDHTLQTSLVLQWWSLAGELIQETQEPCVLESNRATMLHNVDFVAREELVLAARLVQDGQVLARTTLWPEPFKYLTIPEPELKIERPSENELLISAQRPAKGVWLTTPGKRVVWSDNMLDLIPGDVQHIQVEGLGTTEVHATRLT